MKPIIDFLSELSGISSDTLEMTMAWIGLIASFLFTAFGPIYAIFLYNKKRFLDHVTYSGNLIEEEKDGDYLLIRTVQVLPTEDLLPSNILFKWKMFTAIRRSDLLDCFIRMDAPAMDIMQPAIINGLSAIYGKEFIDKMHGKKFARGELLIAVTCEKYGSVRSQKIRVMVVTKTLLEKLCSEDFDQSKLKFERGYHKDRVETLMKMAYHWKQEQSLDIDDVRVVRSVEVPIEI